MSGRESVSIRGGTGNPEAGPEGSIRKGPGTARCGSPDCFSARRGFACSEINSVTMHTALANHELIAYHRRRPDYQAPDPNTLMFAYEDR